MNDENKIHLPEGGSDTDTGDLDAIGNEFGAASLGSDAGRSEGQRKAQTDKGARGS